MRNVKKIIMSTSTMTTKRKKTRNLWKDYFLKRKKKGERLELKEIGKCICICGSTLRKNTGQSEIISSEIFFRVFIQQKKKWRKRKIPIKKLLVPSRTEEDEREDFLILNSNSLILYCAIIIHTRRINTHK